MKNQFARGFSATLPVCLGILPVGVSFGLLAVQCGLKIWEAITMSAMVVAGSSQLMAMGMLVQEASLSAILLATFFINLRFLVMGCSAMGRINHVSLPKKLLLSFVMGDEAFAIFSLDAGADDNFLLGSEAAVYAAWVLSTVAGCFASSVLPELVTRSFGIAMYAAFIGMLVPNVQKNLRLLLLVIITALLNLLFQQFISSSWSVILSMILGALLGVWLVEDQVPADQVAAAAEL